MADAALLELAKRAADAADEARRAANDVGTLIHQHEARISKLESAARVEAPKPPDHLPVVHRFIDKVAEKPAILIYAGLFFALAMGGPAAVSIASALVPTGASHAPAGSP